MKKNTLIVANWKMNLNVSDEVARAKALFTASIEDSISVILCPTFLSITSIAPLVKKRENVSLGAQDCYCEVSGPATGEISPRALKKIGCTAVIVGHSERRHALHESDIFAARKAVAALGEGLSVLFCIGETLQEKNKDERYVVLERQLSVLAKESRTISIKKLMIAYEPVWAIGTGLTMSPVECKNVFSEIRHIVQKNFPTLNGTPPRMLYGGSVTKDSIRALATDGGVDGFLVGSASLAWKDFSLLLKAL